MVGGLPGSQSQAGDGQGDAGVHPAHLRPSPASAFPCSALTQWTQQTKPRSCKESVFLSGSIKPVLVPEKEGGG